MPWLTLTFDPVTFSVSIIVMLAVGPSPIILASVLAIPTACETKTAETVFDYGDRLA